MPRPLPACEYRVDIKDDTRIYCRHTSIVANRHLLPGVACRACPQRTVACEDARPIPTPEQLHDILSTDATMPPVATQAWNLLNAVTDFVADGLKTVSREEYEARLAICEDCDQRRGNRCVKCGCHLTVKARGRAFLCPLRKWPENSE